MALVMGIEQTGRSTLRAIWLNDFGGPERLVAAEAPDPVAGAGQALIEVAFANVAFADTMFRAGAFGPLEAKLPTIPGNGVGGVVASVGVGVENELVGRRVVTNTGGAGGYAERAAVDVGGLFLVPDHLGLDSVLALLADGRTATMLVRAAELGKGERVLVEAAAGGVGPLLVQLAQAAGATVAAAAGGARKVELARGLGAEVAVDYREPGWTARVREAVGGVDVVFDGVGGDIAESAFGLLRRGGRLLSFGMASGEWAGISTEAAADRGVKAVGIPRPTSEETRVFTESAMAEATAGRLRPVIGQRFPWSGQPTRTPPSRRGPPWARRCWRYGCGPSEVDVGRIPARTWSAWPAPPEPARPLDGGGISTSLAHNLVAMAFVLTSLAGDSR